MNKKAVSALMVIFELVVVISLVILLRGTAADFANSERVEKTIIAQDLQMMINTLVGTPGDVIVEYPYNVSGYSLHLTSEGIKVFQQDESVEKHIVKKFNLPDGYTVDGFVEREAHLCLEKKNNRIEMRVCTLEESITQKII